MAAADVERYRAGTAAAEQLLQDSLDLGRAAVLLQRLLSAVDLFPHGVWLGKLGRLACGRGAGGAGKAQAVQHKK
jgi:hypothetical protein